MRNKSWKSIVSYVLALMMILTAIPSTALQVNAATKPTLSASQITLTKGMTQTLKPKNVKSGSQVKWSSKNKSIATVNGKGVVKGVKDGKTTINCVVTSSGKKTSLKCAVTVKTPKFAKDTYSISKGESVSLVLKNKYSKAKYKWSCQDENIAKVNSKGKVAGVGVGETTVTVKISIPKTSSRSAKVITKKVAILVTDGELVTNQEELKKALSNKTIKKIAIKTDQKVDMTIPQGEYKSVELVVDAPKADIINNGVFKNITIKQIAADTWTEKAKGNVLILDAAAGHVVIPNTAGISEIRITNANSNFKLDVQGNVDKISIESPTKIDIKITGTVGTVDVNSRATVSVDGSSTAPIAIKVAEGADGTTLNSNVKVDVTSGSDTEINLSKGAEGSAVQTTNEKKSVEVTNNTTAKVEITNEAGKNQTVDSGKNATVDGSGTVTNSTTGNGSTSGGGGSSSGGGSGSYPGGGASSSGNLTRIISYFDSIPTITAGTSGETLKTVEQIKAMLPTQVTANDIKGGRFTISVTDWVNENNYSENSSAGNYTFSAVLGSASVVYSNPDNKKATVRVHVNTSIGIELGDNDFLEVIHYTHAEKDANDENDTIEYYSIKNTSDKLIRVKGSLKCYDANNYLVTTLSLQGWDRQYLHPGTTGLFTVNYFGDLQYDRCYLDLSSSYEITYEEGESAFDAVKVEGEKKTDELSIKLTNTSERQISTVDVQILFLNENGEVYGWRSTSSDKVYGVGYTDTLNIKYPIKYWKDDNGTWQETVVEPASYLVFKSGVYYTDKDEILSCDNIPSYLEVVHYTHAEKDANDENDTIEYYSIKNTSDKLIRVKGSLKCYDANNYLVTTLSLQGWDRQYLHPGTTGLFTVNYFGDLQYDRCYLDLSSSYEITYEEGESAFDAVKVEGEKKTDELSIKLTNTSERQISTVDVQILFLNENGEVYGWRSTSSDKVYGVGYTDTLNIKYPIKYWKDDNGTWQETVVEPASYLIFKSGVYYTDKDEILSCDNIPSYLEVVHYTHAEKDANDENDTIEYYSIKNTSDKLIRVKGSLKCYDANNYLVTTLSLQGWDRQYLHPGTTGLFTVNYFGDLQYDRCYLDLSSSYEITYEEGESAFDAVKVEGEKKTDELSIKLTNTSERQISTVDVQILFLNENGEVYGWRSTSSDKVYGVGYTDTLNIKYPIKYWKDDNGTWQETVVEPASYLIFKSGVYYTDE